MSKKITKPSGQEVLKAFWDRGKSKSFSNIMDACEGQASAGNILKKCTPPSNEKPTPKKQYHVEGISPKRLDIGETESKDNVNGNQSPEKKQKKNEDTDLSEYKDQDSDVEDFHGNDGNLGSFSKEFRDFGKLMNFNMNKIHK